MAKVILTTKIRPTYDDLPEVRYHFPRRYLTRVEQGVGDHTVRACTSCHGTDLVDNG